VLSDRIVRTISVLSLSTVEAKEALAVARSLMGPFGQALPFGNRLLLRDTAGNLQQIVRALAEVETEGGGAVGSLSYKCLYIKASEARRLLEELLGKPDSRVKGAGQFTLSTDERTNTLHLRGSAERLAEAKAILIRIDVAGKDARPVGAAPVLKIYSVPSGQAEALARTLQQLFRGMQTVRITPAGSNRILVYAAPEDQLEIGRKIQETAPTVSIEVIPLQALEAPRTVELLRRLFAEGSSRRGSGPTMEADASRNAIVIRGTQDQVEEIRSALRKLGETGQQPAGVRTITLEQGDAASLAEELQKMLAKMRSNPVRVVLPGGKPEPATKPPVPGKGAPAVTLTAVGNKLLVTTDDPQALALVQELVRVMSAPGQGELEVIRLVHGSAVEVARTLDELFNGPGSGRIQRVRIVAEPVSNALLVKASPLDLLTIRRLILRNLDVAQDRVDMGTRTFILGPLRHAKAAELAKVFRELFSEGGKPTVSIGVDARTNSLILRCSASVFEDMKRLLEQLDVKVDKKE
jgi:type II secretory pathway component GspD/PulD (secretin)